MMGKNTQTRDRDRQRQTAGSEGGKDEHGMSKPDDEKGSNGDERETHNIGKAKLKAIK